MSTAQMNDQRATGKAGAPTVDLKLEVVVIPVSDVDRSRRFYEGLGWRVDADFANGKDWRVVQMTPPGSPSSIHFGKGVTPAVPGSFKNMYLVVSDITAARKELSARGADVSEPFHFDSLGGKPLPGVDPKGGSYTSFATFNDPDGNSFLLQEIKARFPGRGESNLDVPTLTTLLREAETQHGQYEPGSPKHQWSDFYSAYIVAREQGRTTEEAVKEGVRNVEASLR